MKTTLLALITFTTFAAQAGSNLTMTCNDQNSRGVFQIIEQYNETTESSDTKLEVFMSLTSLKGNMNRGIESLLAGTTSTNAEGNEIVYLNTTDSSGIQISMKALDLFDTIIGINEVLEVSVTAYGESTTALCTLR